ncbi:MAG: ABC transporter substrate-binding protein [Ectothiorhodospiraceae bacterium]|nr:ABC transporter substrate-binding protein [Chromatiales bacterium]MCP5155409.1 ABC transporter substrate-binding protein [Ectothiorhodospiraceae bacterium]
MHPTVFSRSLLAASVLALAGSAATQVQADPKVLKVIPYADLKIVDPIWTTATITTHHGFMIYDTLIAQDENFQVQPQMLEGWKASDDKMTWTFTLRDGLKFHDGAPVRSADCIASIKRWAERDLGGQLLISRTESLEAVDDKTFVLKLNKPFGQVLETLGKISSNILFIMPERIASTSSAEQIKETIGSGPYRFVREEWVPGSKAVYAKFEDYVPRSEPPSMLAGGKVVKVDRVEWYYVPNKSTAMAALNAGEYDFYEAPSIDLLPMVQSNPNITVKVLNPVGLQVAMRPNTVIPPFDNVKARQALQYIVDQSEYMTAMVGNPDFWRACPSLFWCDSPVMTSAGGGERLLTKDLDKAKALLAESGYKGEKVVLMDPTDHPTHAAALLTAANLRKIGMNVEVQAMDWATLTSRRKSKNPADEGGWNVFHTRFGGDASSNPITHLGTNTGCDKAWFGWPCDAEAEKLKEAWVDELDDAKRKDVLDRYHTRLMEVAPFTPVGQYAIPSAYSNKLEGVLRTPTMVLWNISKKE